MRFGEEVEKTKNNMNKSCPEKGRLFYYDAGHNCLEDPFYKRRLNVLCIVGDRRCKVSEVTQRDTEKTQRSTEVILCATLRILCEPL
jgi:hypothetical protein